MMTQPNTEEEIVKEFEKRFMEFWRETRNGHSCIGRVTLCDLLTKELLTSLRSVRERTIEECRENIPMLRQWLNEHRIDDPKKMATNDEIELLLSLSTLKENKNI